MKCLRVATTFHRLYNFLLVGRGAERRCRRYNCRSRQNGVAVPHPHPSTPHRVPTPHATHTVYTIVTRTISSHTVCAGRGAGHHCPLHNRGPQPRRKRLTLFAAKIRVAGIQRGCSRASCLDRWKDVHGHEVTTLGPDGVSLSTESKPGRKVTGSKFDQRIEMQD